jgi:hypothetical protein
MTKSPVRLAREPLQVGQQGLQAYSAAKSPKKVESVISRNKRLLGSALRSRSDAAQARECLLRVLTHNLMILR